MKIEEDEMDTEAVAIGSNRRKARGKYSWKRLLIIALCLGLVLDFICYQLYGVGLIFGNVLTVDIDINMTLR